MIAYSLADQEFARGRSLGILNNSIGLLRELTRQLGPDAITVLANQSLMDGGQIPEGVAARPHDEALGGGLRRIAWDQWGVYRAAKNNGCRWLFLPKGFASFVRNCPVSLAVIINDGMTDHYARHHPDTLPASERYYFTQALRASMRQSTVIFTISHFTAGEVRRLAHRDNISLPPVHAIGVGFDPPPTEVPPGLERRRGLIVLTSRMPHKRTNPTINQLVRWQDKTGFSGPIHLVGSLPDGYALPVRPGWFFYPRPDNEAYRKLMMESLAMIYASEYEGFGMPPVEAALAGLCPVYSNIPVLQEVMTGQGCPFENDVPESFEAALTKALHVPALEIRHWAETLYERYNWPSVARQVADVLVAET